MGQESIWGGGGASDVCLLGFGVIEVMKGRSALVQMQQIMEEF